MSLNIALWFGVFIAGIAAISLTYWWISMTDAFYLRLYTWLLRKMVYRLLWPVPRWSRITRFQTFLLGSYFAINGFVMGIGIHSTSDLISRSGLMASVNLIPLFLGGRTSIFARVLGLSLHSYYLWHHWIGRVVVIQGLLHVSLILKTRSPRTLFPSHISGISSASAMALIVLTSLWFVRKLAYEFFLKVHFFLAMIAIVALLKHLLPFGKAFLPIAAIIVWGINAGLRRGQMAYQNLGPSRDAADATIELFYSGGDKAAVTAMKVNVSLRRTETVLPGEYYYLSFRGMGLWRRWQAHPFVVSWWDDSINASSLDFLIEPRAGITADLTTKNSIRRVVLDGPYGHDLHLEDFETVILVAKGIGIAGILPYVRHMVFRRSCTSKNLEEYRRGLITRHIDLYWELEDNNQQDWLEKWIRALQDRDADTLTLTFTCFYPTKKRKPPPFRQGTDKRKDEYWRFIYEREAPPIIEDLMLKRIARSPGKTKVVVCGNAAFSGEVRSLVLKKAMASYDDIAFAEVEFQPHESRIVPPKRRTATETELEMGVLQPSRQILTKSPPKRTPNRSRIGPANSITRLTTLQEEEEDEVVDVSSSADRRVNGREPV